jgi:serine/threonine protein phosphatase 1
MFKTIEVTRVKRFAANPAGRDIAVGDIHGHFSRLQAALDAVSFDPAVDRLFSVGDLVDRGPESEDVIKWLNKPWFHPVRGNHDDYVARFDTCDIGNWMQNGGVWFIGLPLTEQQNYQVIFEELPIAIEVETAGGIVGIVHADCVFDTWAQMKDELESPESNKRLRLTQNTCMWSRSRYEQQDCRPIPDVRAVVVGHTPIERPAVLGNVHHIDTGGWLKDGSGHFTLLDLATLQPLNPA